MACIKYELSGDEGKRPSTHADQIRFAGYILSIMAHPIRLRIILRLSDGERNVGQLSTELNMTLSKLGPCLGQLRRGGLVTTEHRGTRSYYALTEIGQKIAQFVKNTFTVVDLGKPES